MVENRGQWGSSLGFIFAAAGSAIGLGNIWRFPYVVGQNGGAAFVLLYLIFVVVIGVPYMIAELAVGRHAQSNPVGSIEAIRPKSWWKLVGYLGILTGVGILSFYGVVAGWTLGFIFKMATGNVSDFGTYIGNPGLVILLFTIFMVITTCIVYGGIQAGIERWSKILMPILLVVMIGLIIYSLTLKGASKGLEFYLKPDFSKINGKVALMALGQAFFSLSLGMGLMITYGSYLPKSDNLMKSALLVSGADTLIAIMAGLMIFPALFAMGGEPTAGPGLVFVALPELFMKMPGGIVVGVLFFVLLSVAALTSTISLLEVPVSFLVDQKKWNRKKLIWPTALIIFIVGIPSALSQGASEFWSNFGLIPKRLTSPDFLSHMDFIWGNLSLTVGALMLSIFVGWVWGVKKAGAEVSSSSPGFAKFQGFWSVMIRFVIPVIIFVLLLNVFGIFE